MGKRIPLSEVDSKIVCFVKQKNRQTTTEEKLSISTSRILYRYHRKITTTVFNNKD